MAEPTLGEVHTSVLVVVEKIEECQRDIVELKDEAKKTNGQIATIKEAQLLQQGALGAMRWMLGVGIAFIAAGATISGTIVAIVLGG